MKNSRTKIKQFLLLFFVSGTVYGLLTWAIESKEPDPVNAWEILLQTCIYAIVVSVIMLWLNSYSNQRKNKLKQ